MTMRASIRNSVMTMMVGLFMLIFPMTEADPMELDPVVVTAARSEVPLARSVGSVTILDARAIEAQGIRTVQEALRDVAGIDIVGSGGPGGLTSTFLRGTNSNHTLVLIDGVPANDPSSGNFDLADLGIENIDRIEIVPGAQSTLYGSDAIGGVVQIFTRKGRGPAQASVSFEGGADRTLRETVVFQNGSTGADLSFSYARLTTDGFSRASEAAGNTEKDAYANTTYSSRVGLALPAQTRLEWTMRYNDSRTDLDGFDLIDCFCAADDLNYFQESQSLISSASLQMPVNATWDQTLRFSLHQRRLTATDPDTAWNNYQIDSTGRWFDWQHDFLWGKGHILTAGYEHESLQVDSAESFEEELTNQAGFFLGRFGFESFAVNLGVRHDHNSRFGGEATYKMEMVSPVGPTGLQAWLAYGTGFHGPTLTDLFFPGFSNPDLQPERSRSFELGLRQETGAGKLKLSAGMFHTRVDDLIVFDFATGMPQNIQQAALRGIEAIMQWVPSESSQFSIQYTLTDAVNQDTGLELPRRPRHKASLRFSRQVDPRLRINADLRYVGRRFDNTANTAALGGYLLVQLAGVYDYSPRTRLFVRVENLLDREYEESAGFGTAGLSVYSGLAVTF